ncbi:TonB-dependent receptor plug domain-containing protein [Alteromonas gilva]|uniref:TonB-dependent receptor n=1 Tax=Alteromonas gilva TaxID=2987522 RepID=A0ABT5KZ05_9ALTE|nr:TonB-dependent receptor [Alteromonas gilva]MDC8830013.1 TonB-dependent receptor [Alteromonas gilva]
MPEDNTETIVVTGTRTPKHLYSSPVKVDIINQATIERLSRGTLKQLLDVMPGVVVTRNRKEGYTIQLQGFSADRVLVLMDGQPLVAPTGSAVDIDQISVNNIKQIEIVRGAASVLYGSSAMGGVINIITYTPQERTVSLTAELSSYADNAIEDEWGQLYRLQASDKLSGWHSSLNVQYIDDPGFKYNQHSALQQGVASDKTFIHLDLKRQFSSVTVSTKSRWLDESRFKVLSRLPGQSATLNYLSTVRQWQQDIILAHDNDWQINTRLLGHSETSGNSNGLRDTTISMQEIDAQRVWMGNNEWIAGVTVHQDQLDQQNLATGTVEVDNAERQSVESYAQVNTSWQSLQGLLGSRIQYDSDFGWHQAWRGSISYTPPTKANNWQLRFGIGQSYRVPNLKERYYIFDHSNLGYMIVGNNQLVPETASNVTAGLQWQSQWHSDWQLTSDINLHYTRANDFIDTIASADRSAEAGMDVYVYTNIAKASLQGFDYALTAQNNQWQLQLNYQYLDAQNNDDERLSERPRHLLKLSGTYHFSTINADLQLYAVGTFDEAPDNSFTGIHTNDSVSLNGQFSQQLTAHWRWQLGVENMFDQHQSSQYTQQGLFDARGLTSRRVVLTSTYQF